MTTMDIRRKAYNPGQLGDQFLKTGGTMPRNKPVINQRSNWYDRARYAVNGEEVNPEARGSVYLPQLQKYAEVFINPAEALRARVALTANALQKVLRLPELAADGKKIPDPGGPTGWKMKDYTFAEVLGGGLAIRAQAMKFLTVQSTSELGSTPEWQYMLQTLANLQQSISQGTTNITQVITQTAPQQPVTGTQPQVVGQPIPKSVIKDITDIKNTLNNYVQTSAAERKTLEKKLETMQTVVEEMQTVLKEIDQWTDIVDLREFVEIPDKIKELQTRFDVIVTLSNKVEALSLSASSFNLTNLATKDEMNEIRNLQVKATEALVQFMDDWSTGDIDDLKQSMEDIKEQLKQAKKKKPLEVVDLETEEPTEPTELQEEVDLETPDPTEPQWTFPTEEPVEVDLKILDPTQMQWEFPIDHTQWAEDTGEQPDPEHATLIEDQLEDVDFPELDAETDEVRKLRELQYHGNMHIDLKELVESLEQRIIYLEYEEDPQYDWEERPQITEESHMEEIEGIQDLMTLIENYKPVDLYDLQEKIEEDLQRLKPVPKPAEQEEEDPKNWQEMTSWKDRIFTTPVGSYTVPEDELSYEQWSELFYDWIETQYAQRPSTTRKAIEDEFWAYYDFDDDGLLNFDLFQNIALRLKRPWEGEIRAMRLKFEDEYMSWTDFWRRPAPVAIVEELENFGDDIFHNFPAIDTAQLSRPYIEGVGTGGAHMFTAFDGGMINLLENAYRRVGKRPLTYIGTLPNGQYIEATLDEELSTDKMVVYRTLPAWEEEAGLHGGIDFVGVRGVRLQGVEMTQTILEEMTGARLRLEIRLTWIETENSLHQLRIDSKTQGRITYYAGHSMGGLFLAAYGTTHSDEFGHSPRIALYNPYWADVQDERLGEWAQKAIQLKTIRTISVWQDTYAAQMARHPMRVNTFFCKFRDNSRIWPEYHSLKIFKNTPFDDWFSWLLLHHEVQYVKMHTREDKHDAVAVEDIAELQDPNWRLYQQQWYKNQDLGKPIILPDGRRFSDIPWFEQQMYTADVWGDDTTDMELPEEEEEEEEDAM